MFNKLTLDWLTASVIRSLRTIAQTALGMVTVGVTINEINWVHILSVSTVAGIYSLLTCLAKTVPESVSHGVLHVDPDTDEHQIKFDDNLDGTAYPKTVTLKVNVASPADGVN